MQTRASNKVIQEKKVVVPEGLASAEEEAELQKEVTYAANSIGANMVFVIRIREPHGMPQKVKKVLSEFKLKNVNAVSLFWTSTSLT
jgi:Ribosomal protein L30p/L7e.